jgi:hypothetical protein
VAREPKPEPIVKPIYYEAKERSADYSIARSGEPLRQAEWRDELFKTGIRGKGGQKIEFSRVEPLPGIPGLIRLAGMELDLSGLIGRKADLRTAQDLSPHFRNHQGIMGTGRVCLQESRGSERYLKSLLELIMVAKRT